MVGIQEKSVEITEKGKQKSQHCVAFAVWVLVSILVSQYCRRTRSVSSHMNMWIYWVIELVIQHDEGL